MKPTCNTTSMSARVNSSWAGRYHAKHRFVRISDLPTGVRAPVKVRIYSRSGRFLLQWWDPEARRNLAVRVEGDLLDALSRARHIDERLADQKCSGLAPRRVRNSELVEAFLKDLHRRADAGEIVARSVARYRSALSHLLNFAGSTSNTKIYAQQVDRGFAQRFAAFLNALSTSGNGRSGADQRPIRSARFVLDAVRAAFEWARDPERGRLLPQDFRNPFMKCLRPRTVERDMLAPPDITPSMAADFLKACDDQQLPLFALLILCGLRAAEPCLIFHEDIQDGFLHVRCKPELDFLTKGRRDKRFPLVDPLAAMLRKKSRVGLLFRRGNSESKASSYSEIVAEYRARLSRGKATDSAARDHIRRTVLREAGALNYDAIEAEFKTIACKLNWPRTATLKDFRHLFCTAMANANMPEAYRRFLMGHAPGREAIANYTHLTKLAKFYEQALETELVEPLTVLRSRVLCAEEAA